jgi:hypothetical protein
LSQYVLGERWDKKRRVFCREFIKGCPSYLKIILDTVFNELSHYRLNLRNDLAEQIVEEVLSCRRNPSSKNPPFSRIPVCLTKDDKVKLIDYTKRVAGRVRDRQGKRQLTIEQLTGEHDENAFDTVKGDSAIEDAYDGDDVIDAEQISPAKVTEAMQNFVNDLILDEDDVIRYIDAKREREVGRGRADHLKIEREVVAAERKRSYLTGRVLAGTQSRNPYEITTDDRSPIGKRFNGEDQASHFVVSYFLKVRKKKRGYPESCRSAEWLHEALKKSKLSGAKLAERAELGRQSVYSYLDGSHIPSPDAYVKLCAGLLCAGLLCAGLRVEVESVQGQSHITSGTSGSLSSPKTRAI